MHQLKKNLIIYFSSNMLQNIANKQYEHRQLQTEIKLMA